MVCKYCGSHDWRALGFLMTLNAYVWQCLYCEQFTRLSMQDVHDARVKGQVPDAQR